MSTTRIQKNLVEEARKFIEANLDRQLTLNAIGAAVNTSPYHLQRVFKATVGVSPREYAEQCRLDAFKKKLNEGASVTVAIYDAGFSSSSRLYERSAKQLGMTPGAYAKSGKGQTIKYAFFESPLGLILLAATQRGICFLQFGDTQQQLLAALKQEFRAADIECDTNGSLTHWTDAMQLYFSTRKSICEIALDPHGTDFQKAVWEYLRKIPAGETRTYTEVAEALGKPNAVRAVARACASNKIAIAIPCHRVVRQDGDLAGYRWGIERKKELLKNEGEQS